MVMPRLLHFAHQAVETTIQVQLCPVELGLQHFRDVVARLFLDQHVVNAVSQLQRAVAEFGHFLFRCDYAVAWNHGVKVEVPARIRAFWAILCRCPRPRSRLVGEWLRRR